MYHNNNYWAEMMSISSLKTGGKEIKVMDYVRRKEFTYVGAGIGGGFQNTKELHVTKQNII